MSKQKLKVTGLALETKDGKKVSLTLDEAKELHEQLDEMFGKKQIQYIPSQPVYIRPWWWERQHPYWYSGTVTGESSYTISSNNTGMQLTYLAGQNSAGE